MIWEVDEDCDQALTWPEFQAMYQRCRNDQTGAHDMYMLLSWASWCQHAKSARVGRCLLLVKPVWWLC